MKTAEELGITQKELRNLIRVRNMLKHRRVGKAEDAYATQENDAFNMERTCSNFSNRYKDHNCGTIMCIGGWMKAFELNLSKDATGNLIIDQESAGIIHRYVKTAQGNLRNLFYPNRGGHTLSTFNPVTRKHAVAAIDNFLEHGEPRWEKILPEAST